MKSSLINGVLVLCACFVMAPTAMAEPKDTLNSYDVKFVKETAQANLNEVKLAELATGKATNPELKSCAARLLKDHGMALSQLKALAEKKGVTVSSAIDKDTADAVKDLEKKSGEDFDSAFISRLDKSHVKSIKSFEDAKDNATDADLKAWVDKTLVVIKEHHEKIKALKG